ncbi:MAG: polysaccharide deacetylase family protein [Bacilli bacterium]|nr:polysaccharide deacetylase family protein [Bacilli bacterium]
MINKIKNMNKITLYIILIIFVYIILILLNFIFGKIDDNYIKKDNNYKKSEIKEISEFYKLDISYPRYMNDEISAIVTDYLYDYILNFKKQSEKTNKIETLNINYEIEKVDKYTNILFTIENSLVPGEKYKSILIDEENKKEIFINKIYGNNILNEIKEMFYKKYSEYIYSHIKDLVIEDFNFSFKDGYINVYVNKNIFSNNILYDIYVSKVFDKEKYVFEEVKADKYVAFTFDDGPSEYTSDIVDAFVSNNSKATFFMLGNRMKALGSVVNYVKDNNMEIGSHTYSHKRLTDLTKEEALEEINSTVIVYNELTNENLTLLRPPYGSINNEVMNLSLFPLITWSIDPKDWLNKDPEYIKNHVLETIYDGAIILMHDIYPTSKEAVKMLIPELISNGYKLVTVSELAKIKGKTLVPGQIVREIK